MKIRIAKGSLPFILVPLLIALVLFAAGFGFKAYCAKEGCKMGCGSSKSCCSAPPAKRDFFGITSVSFFKYILFGGGIFFLFLTGFSLLFFRDPERKPDSVPLSENEEFILAPADGKVVSIRDTKATPIFKEPGKVVSIFLSIFNVHVQRSPVKGFVEEVWYKPGSFLVAWKEKASEENEQTTIAIRSGTFNVVVKQIAGIIARRIAVWTKPCAEVSAGTKIGLIRFGSRVDTFLPSNCELKVGIGTKVKGGKTVIGVFSGKSKVKKQTFRRKD